MNADKIQNMTLSKNGMHVGSLYEIDKRTKFSRRIFIYDCALCNGRKKEAKLVMLPY